MKKILESTITVEADKKDIEIPRIETHKNEFQCSLSRPPSSSSSPVKFADDDVVDDDEEDNVSSASSTSLSLFKNDDMPRRHHSKRLSVDNLMVLPTSPTFAVNISLLHLLC